MRHRATQREHVDSTGLRRFRRWWKRWYAGFDRGAHPFQQWRGFCCAIFAFVAYITKAPRTICIFDSSASMPSKSRSFVFARCRAGKNHNICWLNRRRIMPGVFAFEVIIVPAIIRPCPVYLRDSSRRAGRRSRTSVSSTIRTNPPFINGRSLQYDAATFFRRPGASDRAISKESMKRLWKALESGPTGHRYNPT
jgi:hypothetical protein